MSGILTGTTQGEHGSIPIHSNIPSAFAAWATAVIVIRLYNAAAAVLDLPENYTTPVRRACRIRR